MLELDIHHLPSSTTRPDRRRDHGHGPDGPRRREPVRDPRRDRRGRAPSTRSSSQRAGSRPWSPGWWRPARDPIDVCRDLDDRRRRHGTPRPPRGRPARRRPLLLRVARPRQRGTARASPRRRSGPCARVRTGVPPEDDDAYFAALAERVTAGLEAIGFPRCHGDAMAIHPRCARRSPPGGAVPDMDLTARRRRDDPVLDRLRLPDVAGTLPPSRPGRRRRRSHGPTPRSSGCSAAIALREEPPTGFVRGLVVESKGEHARHARPEARRHHDRYLDRPGHGRSPPARGQGHARAARGRGGQPRHCARRPARSSPRPSGSCWISGSGTRSRRCAPVPAGRRLRRSRRARHDRASGLAGGVPRRSAASSRLLAFELDR